MIVSLSCHTTTRGVLEHAPLLLYHLLILLYYPIISTLLSGFAVLLYLNLSSDLMSISSFSMARKAM